MLNALPKGGIVAEVGVAFGDFSEQIIKRTAPKVLHLIDASTEGDQPLADYEVLARELAAYNQELLDRRHLLVLNKIDQVDEERLAELTERFATIGQELLAISAETGRGLEVLKEWIARVMETVRAERRDDLPGD